MDSRPVEDLIRDADRGRAVAPPEAVWTRIAKALPTATVTAAAPRVTPVRRRPRRESVASASRRRRRVWWAAAASLLALVVAAWWATAGSEALGVDTVAGDMAGQPEGGVIIEGELITTPTYRVPVPMGYEGVVVSAEGGSRGVLRACVRC